MRRVDNIQNTVSDDSQRLYWKRRPSEISGYNRTIYLNLENGDYLRVDYNFHDKKVRLYLEEYEEGGAPYYSVIQNGRIVAERNASTGRPINLYNKFSKRAEVFSTITNHRLVKLINKNYGIGEKEEKRLKRQQQRRQTLEKTRKRYFKPEKYSAIFPEDDRAFLKRLKFLDFVDIFIGFSACAGLYYYLHDYIYTGIASAFFGISIGLWDILLRERDPLFFKVILFILLGAALYVYGYYIY